MVRKDIQALRAVAVGLVVIFHLWPNRLTGGFVGVDIFFVISGFLITQHLLRAVETKTFSVLTFWSRRIRRLLPASIATLIATLIGIFLFAPRSIWPNWIQEVGASAAYFENWLLAGNAVDYLAADNAPSPTQHFWSLSVEEQFYFILPLLLLPLVLTLKNSRKIRPAFLLLLGTIVTASFIASIILTFTEPAGSYFYTQVRAWQFGAGALLAAAVLKAPTSNLFRSTVAIGGLILIGFSSFYLQGSFDYPGYWALLPTVGTLLVLVAQVNSGWLNRFASIRPVQFLGDVSYSLYLWHWPIIILFPLAIGAELGTIQKLTVILLSLGLAWLSYKFIEQPFIKMGKLPKARPRNAFAFMAAICVGLLVSTSAVSNLTNSSIRDELQQLSESQVTLDPCLGAGSKGPDSINCLETIPNSGNLQPPLELAAQDNPTLLLPEYCQGTQASDAIPKPCNLTGVEAKTKIAMIGDSHSAQFLAPMMDLAKKNGWQVVSFSKGGCPFSLAQRKHDTVLTEACKNWVKLAMESLINEGFDLVMTSQVSGVTWASPVGQSQETYSELGQAQIWNQLNSAGIPVLSIRDNPRPIKAVIACLVQQTSETYDNCAVDRKLGLLFDPQVGASNKVAGSITKLLDFTDIYCDSKICSSVIGGVIVNRDENHITNTFARTLGPYIEVEIKKLLQIN